MGITSQISKSTFALFLITLINYVKPRSIGVGTPKLIQSCGTTRTFCYENMSTMKMSRNILLLKYYQVTRLQLHTVLDDISICYGLSSYGRTLKRTYIDRNYSL